MYSHLCNFQMAKLLLELFRTTTYSQRLCGVISRDQPALAETQLQRRLQLTAAREQPGPTDPLPSASCALHSQVQYIIVKMKSLYVLRKTEGTGFILHLNTI